MLEGFYALLAANTHDQAASYRIPAGAMLQLGVTYEV